MIHYRYDVICAAVDHHINKHPQVDLKDRGYSWLASEPFSIFDCWIFRFDKELDNPPEYLDRISDDFQFSWERYNGSTD